VAKQKTEELKKKPKLKGEERGDYAPRKPREKHKPKGKKGRSG